MALNGEGEPVEPVKRKRMTLEEKMNNMHCYKNLKPDPNSFEAHDVRQLTKPDENSKRQATLKGNCSKANSEIGNTVVVIVFSITISITVLLRLLQ